MSTRGPNTRFFAEAAYPVRVRVFVPRGSLEWSYRYDRLRAWLRDNCKRRHWVESSSGPGQDHALLVYLASAEQAAAFASEAGLTDQIACRRPLAMPLGCPVYTSD
jgi:hypothetical protein